MYKYVVEIYFKPGGFNFELTGVRLQNGLDSMIVKATYSVTLADEPALAKMKGSKGHSGRKPCLTAKILWEELAHTRISGKIIACTTWNQTF